MFLVYNESMKIKIKNPVWMQAQGKEAREILLPCLRYEKEFWRQSQYSKKRSTYKASLIDKEGYFLAGFKDRIQKYTDGNNVKVKWIQENPFFSAHPGTPRLPNLTLRSDQINIIKKATSSCRGVIKAPTGIGKTVLAMGFLSCFSGPRTLFLVNELTLLEQTYEAMKKQNFYNVGRYGGGRLENDPYYGIIVSTVQSWVRLDPKRYVDAFDIIIVDECDQGMSEDSQLYKILTNSLADIRIGLSATLPQKEENRLYLEGLLGPVIGEMTTQEGINLGLLAKPKVTFVPTVYNSEIYSIQTYTKAYEKGVVDNPSDNRLVVLTAMDRVQKGKTVLIFVTQVEHGKNLAKIAERLSFPIPFVWGGTESEERQAMKKGLQDRELKCVIANKVWDRGINIPSLDVVINAARGKSDTLTEQRDGRGLRIFEGKTEMEIVEFVDVSNRYLSSHFAFRLNFYTKKGWL